MNLINACCSRLERRPLIDLLPILFAAVTLLSPVAGNAAAVYAGDLSGDEHVNTFEGFVGFDSFIIVANTGQKWDHDGALFSHTGTIGGVGLSTRIPLTGGTNTVMLTQQSGANLLVEFDVPVGLAGATIFNDRTTATFFDQSGAILGAVTSDLFVPRQFIGWSVDPGTGWIKSVLFQDFDLNNSAGLAIDNLVRGNPVPLPAAAYLLG
ncbi:MAG: hypothetical protein KJO38_02215, partial [Gammaproteobacteria bacterium]|nr:hypothetical protein [Gammaproteobacteria bacterium]